MIILEDFNIKSKGNLKFFVNSFNDYLYWVNICSIEKFYNKYCIDEIVDLLVILYKKLLLIYLL